MTIWWIYLSRLIFSPSRYMDFRLLWIQASHPARRNMISEWSSLEMNLFKASDFHSWHHNIGLSSNIGLSTKIINRTIAPSTHSAHTHKSYLNNGWRGSRNVNRNRWCMTKLVALLGCLWWFSGWDWRDAYKHKHKNQYEIYLLVLFYCYSNMICNLL